uniref:CYTH domain-containing protein n=1 Tax=Steinernema glaseri TaxID=37863 RepID=A0A1I8A047_9BILA
MPRNVEIKAKVNDLPLLMTRLEALKGKETPVILRQQDTFFKSFNGRLKLRELLNAEGHCEKAELIFYDRPDVEGPKISDFVRTEVADAAGLKAALTSALSVVGQVKKVRTLVIFGQTRIHIDEVEGLGSYMELEVCLRDEQSLEDGEQIAHEIMTLLAIPTEALVSGAYMDALLAT